MPGLQMEPVANGGDYDVIVVGAGFAGVYAVHRLRSDGFRVHGIEAGKDIGGTWYWNRYPGARCDVESLQYSYSFSDALEQEWSWTERFATQPEILRYLGHVADRFDLRREFSFETRVIAATFDDAANLWTVETETGRKLTARYCVMATGCLSASRIPTMVGLEDFRGKVYHTGQWPHEDVDFSGQKVAVIGTGSSGIQAIPPIAEQADQLFVFQRTANFAVPARNRPLSNEQYATWRKDISANRQRARDTRSGVLFDYGTGPALATEAADRADEYERRWATGGTNFLYAYNDLLRDDDANATAADFVRAKIAATVTDPEKAELLTPKGYPIGAKRICVDTGYFETYNRDNVTLVDVRAAPISKITAEGICSGGHEYVVDAIVFATGFDAMTGALLTMDIRGSGGLPLRTKWAAGPRTLLGLMTAGFPNLFLITGPGSPSVLSNMVTSIEQHVEWIADCLGRLRGATRIEADLAAEDRWVDHVNEVAAPTLYSKANSWYIGANVPGKPRVFMPYIGGADAYRRICNDIAAKDYEGFVIEPSGAARSVDLPR